MLFKLSRYKCLLHASCRVVPFNDAKRISCVTVSVAVYTVGAEFYFILICIRLMLIAQIKKENH